MIIDTAKENVFVTSISTGIQYQVLAFKLRNNKVIEYLIDNKYADMWHSGIQENLEELIKGEKNV